MEGLIGKKIVVNRVIFKNKRTGDHYHKIETAIINKVLEPEKYDKRYEIFFKYQDGSVGFIKVSKKQLQLIGATWNMK